VSTPTEVHNAVKSGLTWLKAFPAAHLGTQWFTAIRGPFPEAQFIATGGVRVADVLPLRAAGVRTVALGSALSNPEELALLTPLVEQLKNEPWNVR
jgi:2-dehydro-3-deoxyphosphogluconate aldolase/(4S)-4-hydroxy-2-oxoglutarate aldolase